MKKISNQKMFAHAKRMLIIEDTESIAQLLSSYFKQDGFSVNIAPTLRSATSLYEASISTGSLFDVLLIDKCLPDGSGIEFLQKIDTQNYSCIKVMLSADGSGETKKRALAAGIDHFLEKPFNIGALQSYITRRICAAKLPPFETVDNTFEAKKTTLVRNYIKYLKNLKSELQSPTTYKSLKSLLHQLKGSAALYEFPALSSTATTLHDKLEKNSPKLNDSVRQELCDGLSVLFKTLPEGKS